jgi:hypothetical protein
MDRTRPSFSSKIYAAARGVALCFLLLFGYSPLLVASMGISLVQHKGKDAGTNTTGSLNFPSPNTAGNFIAVAIRGGLSSSQVFTVKDSNGNSYKKATQIGFTTSAVTSAIYYAESIKGGANTVTVSMTVNAPLRFAILEYSGVATSNSLDSTAAAAGTGTAASSGNTTTAVNGDLLLGSVSTVNSATFTAGAGYVIRDSVPNGSGAKLITEDQIQAAAGTASVTATLAASDTWGALLAAFKPAGGVAAPGITSLSPTTGPAGTSVTITGTNFGASQGTSTVTFNGTAATPTSWSATSIVVPMPSGATTGNVVVTVGSQASNGVAFTVIIPPSITSLSPTAGLVGTSVTITGTSFGASQGNSTVSFNGSAATPTSWSATSIVVPVPNSATTGNVVVTVGGLASNGVTFTVAPSITSLSPASGPAGTSVTIAGRNFGPTQGTSSVMFGSSTATVTGWSNTSVVAIVPGNLSAFTNVAVKVVVSGAASNAANFAIAPSITSINPTSGPAGTSITITGTNFASTQGSSTVAFSGTAATPTSWSATSIVVPVPSGATTGNVVVTVGGLASNGVLFTVIVPPSITSLNPTSGPVTTSVTITGTNFGASQGTSSVAFNGIVATPTSWNSTSIVVLVPNGGTTGNIVVTVSNLGSNGVPFTVTPSITSLSPTSGSMGTSVTITGTSFGATQGGSTVSFGRFAATPTSWNATTIVAPVPAGATTGNVIVTVNGIASNGVTFTVVPPSITSLNPNAGPAGTSVTITGANFGASQGTSQVTFNGTSASPTSWSDTSIGVPVPGGATTGNVVVTVGGVASNGVAFTVVIPPSITSLSPTSGPVGTAVTISGTNFGASQGTSTISLNGTQLPVTNWTATSIATFVPNGATTGNVVVTVGGFASNGVLFTVTPSINSLSPTSGPAGTSVTITGTNFGPTQGTSSLTFGSSTAVVTSWSNTSVVAIVPGNLSAYTFVAVQVVVSGVASNSATFGIAPSITSLSPTSGPAGTSITITGTNFASTQGSSTVTFNGTQATPTTWSGTSIVVPVPSGATTGNVVVTVSGLASNGVTFTVPPPPPSISSLSPTSGPVGTSVTISGGNWGTSQGSSTVTFNGTLATPTSWSAGAIVVPAPPGATTGNVVVTFGGVVSNSVLFTVTPTITSLSPNFGPVGASVTITGTNFGTSQAGGSSVAFNGIFGTPTSWSQTSIVVPVPNGASTGNVVVAVVNAGASNAVLFNVTPLVSGLNPFSGDTGTPITISGSNFGSTQGTSTVAFNGTLATPTSWSNTSIVAPVPAGATTGNIVVTVGGFASNGASFTVAPDNTPPTAPSNLTATAVSAGEIDLYWTASTDNVGVSGYQVERCQGTGCTNFTLFASVPEPNVPTSMSDVSVVGSTSYTYRVRATDAAGNLSSYSNTASATTLSAATITSLNPASGVVGTSVTITGTGFGPAQTNSTVAFNGTQTFPASWSDTSIVVPVPSGATTGNVVITIGGLASNGVNFTVTPPPPPPSITSVSPSSAVMGGGPFTITVTGTNFVSSSAVQWNGNALATTFLSTTQLQATVTSSNIASIGAAKITVSNASLGGGVSNVSTFFVGTTGGSNFAAIVVNQAAQDIVYDPKNQVFYLSVPGTASSYSNTIAVLDPTTATLTSVQPTGNNPNVLAISDDSQFLYAGIDGASTVQRFILPGLVPDISYSLGTSQYFGPYSALDLQVAPGAPHTTAVSLGNRGVSPAAEGGIVVFDDTAARPTRAPGFERSSNLFGSIQWGSDPVTLFASNSETTGFDFYTLAVNLSGVTLTQDFPGTFTSFGDSIHFDPGTKLIYSDEGHAINPATGIPVGNFNATGALTVDATLNTAFFASVNSNSTAAIQSFDLTHFTPITTITIPNATGTPVHLIRWGQRGLAFINKNFNGTSQVVLLGGDFVSAAPPFVLTPPPAPFPPPVPAPNAPTITSLNPSSTSWPNQRFVLNISGTQFDPAATVLFNAMAMSTTFVSSTQLQALIPPATVSSSGTASVVVANPPANGGNSASATFFVGLSAGTSSTGTGFAFQILNQASKQIAFDPASQRLYLSAPNSLTTGNTIAVLDPATTTIIGQQYAGSNPNILTISDDGQFLYAGLDGSSSVQRFVLPGLAPDITYPLGSNQYFGPYFALDLQVAPGAPHTTAVTLGNNGTTTPAEGGMVIFDDATPRATTAPGAPQLFSSIQWGSDVTALFAANNESTGFDFYTLSVNSSGVSLTSDFPNTFSSFHNNIHFDPGTKLVYSDDGHVLDPATGASIGTFPISGLMTPVMVPDSSLNLAFFATQTGSSAIAIYSYNLTTFAPVSSIFFSVVNGNPVRLIRWGQNGLALNTDAGQIVLLGGNFVH